MGMGGQGQRVAPGFSPNMAADFPSLGAASGMNPGGMHIGTAPDYHNAVLRPDRQSLTSLRRSFPLWAASQRERGQAERRLGWEWI